ncbi:MAG: glycosyltransferase [Lachnospiraceae bacterium]|nr:glycosyltransferase [Lachnospiraceae bacterium]
MKKRILFVIPYMHGGGAQRALSNIQAFLADTYEIDTLLNSEIGRVYPSRGRVITLGLDQTPKTGSVIFQFRAFIRRIRKLRRLKKSGRYTACISLIDSANIANILSGRKHCKCVISIRTSLSSNIGLPQYKYIVNPLARLLYRRADTVVAVSEELGRELTAAFHLEDSRISVIQNGFDLKTIRSRSEEQIERTIADRIGENRVILTAGRLDGAKHQWHLIRAFSGICSARQDAVLVIAGDGELMPYLKALAKRLKISERVIFPGFTENVYQYMRRADVFVLPSGFEGFPNALGEALCVGTPCIATDFRTGAREILAPELLFNGKEIDQVTECTYGILTPVCSGTMYKGNEPLEPQEKELAGAMARLLGDEQLRDRYREKSMERSSTLDIQSVVKKWIEVIEA